MYYLCISIGGFQKATITKEIVITKETIRVKYESGDCMRHIPSINIL